MKINKSGHIGFLILLFIGCTIVKEKEFPVIKTVNSYECGPRCLQMIYKYYGKEKKFEIIAEETKMTIEEGTNLNDLSKSAEKNGFKTLAIKIPYETKDQDGADLLNVPLPGIAYWEGNYFVVLTKVGMDNVVIVHPEKGEINMRRDKFCKGWYYDNTEEGSKGVILLLEKN